MKLASSCLMFCALLSSCASKTIVLVPEKGPMISEIMQIDRFPIGEIDDEFAVMSATSNQIDFPVTTTKERAIIFDDEIEITWVQNGSGIDLLKVNQSSNTTWQLLNKAILKSDYNPEVINEQFGKVLVVTPDGIEFLDTSDDSFSLSKSESEERFKIEFRVDAVDDGTVISLQFEDDLLLPADDNLIHLDNIRQLMIQE
ncbi:hypothetical protein [Marinicellulosiphila megalodicopiae]|uniref:hypothetical protein n=1 Tax=Marinicellulosiphila megalodicopiae TaxID=2724896 RepID=UPI003BB16A8A